MSVDDAARAAPAKSERVNSLRILLFLYGNQVFALSGGGVLLLLSQVDFCLARRKDDNLYLRKRSSRSLFISQTTNNDL